MKWLWAPYIIVKWLGLKASTWRAQFRAARVERARLGSSTPTSRRYEDHISRS